MITRRVPLVIALALTLVSVASPVLAQQYRLHEISLGGSYSNVTAINEEGVAVGDAPLTDGTHHAWYFAEGVVTDVGTFGGTSSFFRALNARGDGIGEAYDASGQRHAFAYRDGVKYQLTPVGFLQSYPLKINQAGQVIGYAFNGTRSVGFLATPTNLGYSIEVIQFQTTGHSYAYDLNDRGMVVGYATVAAGVYHPFLYDSATSDMRNLGTFGGTFGYAVDINEAGDVTGYAQNATSRSIAFLYLNGTASKVPLEVPGNDSYGDRINDNGQVTVRAWDGTASHAYLYSAGQLRSIAPAGSYYSYMTGLTDRGDVFGTYAYTYVTRFSPYSCGPFATCYTEWREYSWRAFVYNGLAQPLSRANGTSSFSSVNAAGQAVVNMNGTAVELWNGSLSGPINLPNAVSASVSSRGLNNHGEFVATSSAGRAFLYRNGSVVDLNDLVSRPDATLQMAHVFTDSGHIGGTGLFDGAQKAYVLLELFDTDGDGVVDEDDNCPAVVNEDQSDWDQNSIGDACDVNALPVAAFFHGEAKMGQPISFDATSSRDPDGGITRYEWDFQYDGVTEVMTDGSPIATHEYASAGTFTVALRVTDNRGGAAFFFRPVLVTVVDQDPPVITLTSPLDGAVYGLGQSLNAEFACADVSHPVTCSGVPSALDTSQPGTFTFTVTAQDGSGNIATKTATFTVRAGRERQWQQAAPLPGARSFADAVTLDDGAVLVLGGFDASTPQLPSAQAWMYSSTSNRWSSVPDMSAARGDAAVVKLRDGRVLVSGGDSLGGRSASAEIFNPATRGWTPVANMSIERSRHTLTVLSDGRLLATGGYLTHTDPYQAYQRTAEIYDPAADTWTRVGDMADRRVGHTASLLPDGRVLVVGGADYAEYKQTVEVFDPVTNLFSPGTHLNDRRYFHSAVTMPDGRILIAGGMNHFQVFSNALIYDPVTTQWQSAGAMSRNRVYFSMVMMADGRVLAAGGSTGQAATGAADVYNPVTGAWTAVLDLPIPRVLAAAAPLRDGGALIASGAAGSVIDDVEIWNGARLIPHIMIPAVTSTGGQPVQVRVLTNVFGRPVTLTLGSTSYGPIETGANGEVIFTNVGTVGFPSGVFPEALVASTEADEVTSEGRGVGSLETIMDNTPPLVTPNPEGAIHASGWYTSDVSLTWSVFDAESPVTSSAGCAVTSVNEDTAGVTFTCSATSAGGTSTVAFTIKRDTTAPAIASPLDGATFERGASIPMSFVCSDLLNEPTTCTSAGAFLDTSTVGARSFTVTGTDAVGNQAQQISSYFVAPPTNAFLWTKLPPSTPQPGPRYGHGMVYDTQRKKTILIGGMAQDGTLLNDVWERDSATGVWIQVTPPLGAGPEPFPRHTFGIAYDEDRGVVIMYAGRVAPQYSNVRTNGDTWEWNPATRAWRQIGTATPIVTAGFIEPSLAWDPVGHRVILFGGRPYYGMPHNAMTYAFNGTTWVQIAHQGPEGRARAAMSTDSRRGRVLLHGGWNRNDAGQWWTLTDTWEWDGSRWVQMNEAGDIAPPYRSSPALAYDAERGVTVLFGGTDGLFLQLLKNDTWEWNGRTWRSRETTGNPSRRVTSMVYDVDARQLVMVGGNGASGDPNYDFLGHGALGDIFVGSGFETITSSLVPQPATALFGADLTLRAGLVGRGGAPIIGRRLRPEQGRHG